MTLAGNAGNPRKVFPQGFFGGEKRRLVRGVMYTQKAQKSAVAGNAGKHFKPFPAFTAKAQPTDRGYEGKWFPPLKGGTFSRRSA